MKAQAASYLQFAFILKKNIYFGSMRVGLLLFTITFIDNELCSFCQEDRETLSHLFLTCGYVGKLWDENEQCLSRHGMLPLIRNTKTNGMVNKW